MWNRLLALGVTLIMISTTHGLACADERYYMVVFASQAEPNAARLAHTFATFIKTTDEGQKAEKEKIEVHTISWLPQTLNIMPLRLRPEAGINLDLPKALKFAETNGTRVTAWGPVVIEKKLYDMAVQKVDELNSGKVAYIVLDGRMRVGGAVNCIHAVSDLDTTQPLLATGSAHGDAASESVFQHLQKWRVPSQKAPDWLPRRIGLRTENIRFAELREKSEPLKR